MNKWLILWTALAVAGCAPQVEGPAPAPASQASEQTASFLSLVSAAIETALARAPKVEPVLVDVESFVAAGRSVGVHDIDAAAICAAVQRELLNVPTAAAVVRRGDYNFEVLNRGIHLSSGWRVLRR